MSVKRSTACTGMGLVLLALALLLCAYNVISDKMAGDASASALAQLQAIAELAARDAAQNAYGESGWSIDPDRDMPTVSIDGQNYIGELDIPSLSLCLPVISEWSYGGLNVAPCRYSGSAYSNTMVIAGHDYFSHFGRLSALSPGDEVEFRDVEGNVFRYKVADLETIEPFDVEGMTTGDWDLTLFTCTVSGRARLAVRCDAA